MLTECPIITAWILQRPWKVRNIKNGRAAGCSPCIMHMAEKMLMPLPSGIIRIIQARRRLCKRLYSAGFPRLPTILNSEDEDHKTISLLFFTDRDGVLHQSD